MIDDNNGMFLRDLGVIFFLVVWMVVIIFLWSLCISLGLYCVIWLVSCGKKKLNLLYVLKLRRKSKFVMVLLCLIFKVMVLLSFFLLYVLKKLYKVLYCFLIMDDGRWMVCSSFFIVCGRFVWFVMGVSCGLC